MGKRTEYTTQHGINLTEAYIKISNPAIQEYGIINAEGNNKKQFSLNFSIEIFANKASRDEGKPAIEIQNYASAYNVNSANNVYAQAYDYLKTLPEFADAEDC